LRADQEGYRTDIHPNIQSVLAHPANANLVSAQNQIPLAHAWGGGEVASADGMRFVVPMSNCT